MVSYRLDKVIDVSMLILQLITDIRPITVRKIITFITESCFSEKHIAIINAQWVVLIASNHTALLGG